MLPTALALLVWSAVLVGGRIGRNRNALVARAVVLSCTAAATYLSLRDFDGMNVVGKAVFVLVALFVAWAMGGIASAPFCEDHGRFMKADTFAYFSVLSVKPLFEALESGQFAALRKDCVTAADPSNALAVRLSHCENCLNGFLDVTLAWNVEKDKKSGSRLVYSTSLTADQTQTILSPRSSAA